MPKVPKINLHICAISSEKYGGWSWFLSVDKHKSFRQVNSITLGVHSQSCPKYTKQQVKNIVLISQGKGEGWSWFLACS